MIRSGPGILIFLSNGGKLAVSGDAKKVLDSIRYGRDQFIEFRDDDGWNHFVNFDHIVDIKELDNIDGFKGRRSFR